MAKDNKKPPEPSFAKASTSDKSSADKSEGKEINIEDLKKQLEECQKQKDEYLEGWKRERAGFLNYKKDEIERIEALIKYANEELLLKFLPILDNICLAEKQMPDDLKDHKWTEGVMQIKSQIANFLNSQGVEEIKAMGEKFDPNFHEAVEDVPTETLAKAGVEVKEPGIVVEEVQKGYLLNGKVIRPVRVKISK